jgi:hypothetical protein
MVLLLLIVSATLQDLLQQPGENLAVLLPHGPLAAAPRAAELMRFFFRNESLPLLLILFILLVAGVGFGAVFQKRAQD